MPWLVGEGIGRRGKADGREVFRTGYPRYFTPLGACELITALIVPARIVWTRFCNSGCLSHGISLTGFQG